MPVGPIRFHHRRAEQKAREVAANPGTVGRWLHDVEERRSVVEHKLDDHDTAVRLVRKLSVYNPLVAGLFADSSFFETVQTQTKDPINLVELESSLHTLMKSLHPRRDSGAIQSLDMLLTQATFIRGELEPTVARARTTMKLLNEVVKPRARERLATEHAMPADLQLSLEDREIGAFEPTLDTVTTIVRSDLFESFKSDAIQLITELDRLQKATKSIEKIAGFDPKRLQHLSKNNASFAAKITAWTEQRLELFVDEKYHRFEAFRDSFQPVIDRLAEARRFYPVEVDAADEARMNQCQAVLNQLSEDLTQTYRALESLDAKLAGTPQTLPG